MATVTTTWSLKPGAEIQNLHPTLQKALPLLALVWSAMFPEDSDGMVVTSGHEGAPTDPPEKRVHGVHSKHYIANNASGFGEAIDLRVNDVQQYKAARCLHLFWTVLETNFPEVEWYIFPESWLKPNAHLHIQMS
jgi:hypothetical protein